MSQSEHSSLQFQHTQQFAAGEVVETLQLGPHERHYEQLFAEVLADGVITPEERVRLNEAADSLGLDRAKLMRLETAMLDAYRARHNVEVVEHYLTRAVIVCRNNYFCYVVTNFFNHRVFKPYYCRHC